MINAGRRIEFAIFTLKAPVSIGKSNLEPGLQQLFLKHDTYFFKKVGEDESYASVPISENVSVLKVLFSGNMFTGGIANNG